MRHDEERPRTSGFLADGTVPGHWTQVLGSMRENPFTHLSLGEVRAEAAHHLVVAPSPEIAHACFGEMLSAFDNAGDRADARGGPRQVEVAAVDELVPDRVLAGTWVFLPHRQDGWTELEDASAKVRTALVEENSSREGGCKMVLMEYGINLWMWAEPPSSGGDPVCHAGELISWESAWALSAEAGHGTCRTDGLDHARSGDAPAEDSATPETSPPTASARPPIYFGLPPILRQRRWDG
ncbi:hypothetical protein [Brevibacterium permense]|uniref:Uncharacterized protein n=1 Tax=Brevibacterium permense TaxID=234834 RepID=A0ABN2AAX2_9MICO|nr:hypothetical protein [Brevibacterium permense]